MSGCSLSFTFPATQSNAGVIANAIIENHADLLNGYFDNNCLCTSSRNNWLEYSLHRLINGFGIDGLDYLSCSFNPEGAPAGGWFVLVLNGDEIICAINGLNNLISHFQRDVDATSRILQNAYISGNDILLVQTKPFSPIDAIEQYKLYSSGGEGDDIASLVTFLHGHLSVLDFAANNSLSVVYAVWLY